MFVDNVCLNAFKGFIEKWPKCPLCGSGNYQINDLTTSPNKGLEYQLTCKGHLSASISHRFNYKNNFKYTKKVAKFSIHDGKTYSITWNSSYPEFVYLHLLVKTSSSNNMLFSPMEQEMKTIKIKFKDFDKWFVSKEKVEELVGKYTILI